MKRRAYKNDRAGKVAAVAGELKTGLLRAIAADDKRDRRRKDRERETSLQAREAPDGER